VAVSLRQLGGSVSTGIIASEPYTIVNGASPVEDWGVLILLVHLPAGAPLI
ncbi:hypothetical protein A2U01_0061980, partial [Trifolium medium]|nr:hypothetical protein [Trifolium medium]